MDLRQQGFRFCAHPENKQFRWVHPLEKPLHCVEWIDCTDMSDDEFDAFVRGAGTDRG